MRTRIHMKHTHLHRIAAAVLAVASLSARAHGDEPHGDAPHPVAAAAGPRFEAATDLFEIVGRLEEGVLSLFIQRFETSEPLSKAQVELESGALKAVAAYQPAQGAYVVSDARFIEALSRPGHHPLVVTVLAGRDSDLLQATLDIAAPAAQASRGMPRLPVLAAAGALAALGAVGGALALRRRARTRGER